MDRAENSNSLDITKSNRSDLRELDAPPVEPLRVQLQLLDEETQALQEELTSLLNATYEMSALNNAVEGLKLQITWIGATKSWIRQLRTTVVAGRLLCFFYLSKHFRSSFLIGTFKVYTVMLSKLYVVFHIFCEICL
ncbi:hypothetical protein GIB67_028383 [Kingdonia uniflora]|uniref:Uncharacterized protein n=1 Tax=Kingdonia uniflora TaxID=39325 RepID=A0A7J7MI21_9MAGN|nr:hypothetical protein GIB67_028383 [Kingdonia uniflora]